MSQPNKVTEVPANTFKQLAAITTSLVQRLSEFSGVDPGLVSSLVQLAKSMAKPKTDEVDEHIFMAVMLKWFGLTEKHIMQKMFDAIKANHSCKTATVEEISRVLCVFFSDNLDLKIDFIFHVYDINGDGLIDIMELTLWLKESAVVMEEEVDAIDPVQDLIQITADSLGISSDGPVTVNSFRAKVKKNPLFIQVLGQCLPSREAANKFLSVIKGKSQMEMKAAFGNIREKLLFDHPDPLDTRLYPVLLDLP